MKYQAIFTILLGNTLTFSIAQECSDIAIPGHSWNQGQNGELQIEVPEDTLKWMVEITYDKLPNSINAWQGNNGRCKKNTGICSFKSQSYNRKKKAGDVLNLGYQIQFDEDPSPPIVTSVKFLYCSSRPCASWNAPDDSIKQHVLCPGESTDTSSEVPTVGPTGAPTDAPTDSPSGGECIGSSTVLNSWSQGLNGELEIIVPEDREDWEVTITFDMPVNTIQAHQGNDESCDGNVCKFWNENWNGDKQAGDILKLTYMVQYDDAGHDTDYHPTITSFEFNGSPCGEGESPSSEVPTEVPTEPPTEVPTEAPTEVPTEAPTDAPTEVPTEPPTEAPTEVPTDAPTEVPTEPPTEAPTDAPTEAPTDSPTEPPTEIPTMGPTEGPTNVPTESPTEVPTDAPTDPPTSGNCAGIQTTDNAWNTGATGNFQIAVPKDTSSWELSVTFNKPVNSIEAYQGVAENCDGMTCTFSSEQWNGVQQQGNLITLTYQIQYDYAGENPADFPMVTSFTFAGVDGCEGENPPTQAPTLAPTAGPTEQPTAGPTNGPTDFPTDSPTDNPTEGTTQEPVDNGECTTSLTNYKDVIHKSLLFYEAQRSGALPEDNRIEWRKDSALMDGSDVGVDLTGGYYDAGDHVKFGFPAAAAMTVLAWGGISYEAGYRSAGEFEYLLDAVKWGTDYFIKCHVADNEFYGQVGQGGPDHSFWGRPEDMTMARPSYKIESGKCGSDLAGETAASFASASILFKGEDDAYSAELLDHAKRLYAFADSCRGKYTDAIWDAGTFYNSWNGYNDELVWGAAWLYKATGDEAYLNKAKQYYQNFNLAGRDGVFSWDDKNVGVHALMAELTGDAIYKNSLQGFCDKAVSSQTRSPNGMLFYYQWGSLRYASNAAFICLKAADLIDGKKETYTDLAQGQMDYILGKHGQSFVVGYGPNSPQNPHHRGASCPDAPAHCPNNGVQPFPHVLEGALVGGPGSPDDQYNDAVTDYIENEVTLDYNAGFQSVLAGLQEKKCLVA